MPHHIYHTEALILGTRPFGEGDRMLYCYTRDHGLVVAHARSIREARSRLRYALQTFSHAYIDLIHGKHGWKLISATPIASHSELWKDEAKRRIVAGQLHLARRLIQGEEEHTTLFRDIVSGIDFLRSLADPQLLQDAELLSTARLLAHLGYWGAEPHLAFVGAQGGYTEENLRNVRKQRGEVLLRINQALHSTQL